MTRRESLKLQSTESAEDLTKPDIDSVKKGGNASDGSIKNSKRMPFGRFSEDVTVSRERKKLSIARSIKPSSKDRAANDQIIAKIISELQAADIFVPQAKYSFRKMVSILSRYVDSDNYSLDQKQAIHRYIDILLRTHPVHGGEESNYLDLSRSLPRSKALETLSEKDFQSILSDAFSSARLHGLLTPALRRSLSTEFQAAADRPERVERTVDFLVRAVNQGIATTDDEAARLAALPAKGKLPTWAGRHEAGLGHLNPVQFYEQVWGAFRDRIYLDELNERDEKLSRAIRSISSRNPAYDAKAILPPPGHVRTERTAKRLSDESLRAAVRMEDRKRKAGRPNSLEHHHS